MPEKTYDFIVVGSGASGACVASRLAATPASPTVLLLEAGPRKDVANADILAERWTALSQFPSSVRNRSTVPQDGLKNRSIGYARGEVVGGSSAINMCGYTIGPKDDYEHWATLVGDESFGWKNALRVRSEKLEAFDAAVTEEYAEYAEPDMTVHGTHGAVAVSLPKIWEEPIKVQLDAARASGLGINLDINSGNPLGLASAPSTAKDGLRVTAAKAYLDNAPGNLTIVTNKQVVKIMFEGKRATGIRVADGEEYRATREVIISAGAVDTPKLLMLSGVGDSADLARHNIETVHHLPGVGKNLQDHLSIPLCWREKHRLDNWQQHLSNEDSATAARSQFLKDGTGPMGVIYQGITLGFFKADEVFHSEEFRSLDSSAKEHLCRGTVPIWELSCYCAPCTPNALAAPGNPYLTIFVFIHNSQSRGKIRLSSASPDAPPLIDPQFFSHPFDRVCAVAATKRALAYTRHPLLATNVDRAIDVPASDSEKDILDYWKSMAGSTWHPACTMKMGHDEDEGACVLSDFTVKGLQALRVVDLSVLPFLLSCHPVSVAYLVGEIAAEKLAMAHGLDA